MVIHRSQIFTTVLQSTAVKSFFIRNMSVSVKSLIYKEYGEPGNVVQLSTSMLDKPKQNEVSVKWILAPVNPADINTIQGKYPSKPPLPAIPGNEGVGEIVAVGPNVQGLDIGDQVVPLTNHLGTWRTHMNCKSEDVMKIPKEVGRVEASMITVNPPTAYRMLKDYVTLKPGDTVIQNGGNSAVGQLVIQLCKVWNLKSVNVVRDRPNIQELKKQLMNLGATEVFTEEEIRTTTIFKSKQLPAPKLAFNCICGQSGVNILRHLDQNGVMVTYGGMSREPITVPASALIFKNIALRGYWMTAWSKANANSQERVDMFKELTDLFVSKKLQAPPHKLIPFDEYHEAITKALDIGGKTGVKYILDMSKS